MGPGWPHHRTTLTLSTPAPHTLPLMTHTRPCPKRQGWQSRLVLQYSWHVGLWPRVVQRGQPLQGAVRLRCVSSLFCK